MIEDAIALMIGVCAATLIALACVPLIWRRALKEARRRIELTLPLTAREIAAQRDAIRAESAVSRRRIEQTLESNRERSAAVSIELGRRTVSLADAEVSNIALRGERAALIAEDKAAQAMIRDLEAQRGSLDLALHQTDERLTLLSADHRRVAAERDSLSHALASAQSEAANVAQQNVSLRERVADRQKESESIRAILADLRLALATVTRERDQVRTDLTRADAKRVSLEDVVATRREAVDAMIESVNTSVDGLTKSSDPGSTTIVHGVSPDSIDDRATLERRLADLADRLLHADRTPTMAADEIVALRREVAGLGAMALRVLAPTTPAHIG